MTGFFYDSYRLIALFFLPGVFLGVFYDLIRMARVARRTKLDIPARLAEKIHPPCAFAKPHRLPAAVRRGALAADRVLVFAEDLLFFGVAAIVEILLTFHANGGEIRIYGLLSSALGFGAYAASFGRFSVRLFGAALYLLRCLLLWMLFPIVFVLQKTVFRFSAALGARLYARKQQRNSLKRQKKILSAAECGFPAEFFKRIRI